MINPPKYLVYFTAFIILLFVYKSQTSPVLAENISQKMHNNYLSLNPPPQGCIFSWQIIPFFEYLFPQCRSKVFEEWKNFLLISKFFSPIIKNNLFLKFYSPSLKYELVKILYILQNLKGLHYDVISFKPGVK